ncbi:MAG: carboxylesterase family protein [Acidimicrobiales bacterium]|nr:carboxylesterase family protein [Acidimicrobiales bacterium]
MPRRRTPATDPARLGRLYLAASAAGALNTANARRPVGRGKRLGTAGFFPGWLTSELPLHTLGWQALATAAFVRKGALRTPAGWIGLGLTAASGYGLLGMWKESTEAGVVFDDALREGLGDELDAGEEPMAPREEVELVRRRIVRGPLQSRRKRYVNGPSFSYGDAGPRNTLDVWRRPDLPLDAGAPVLINVHGGGWVIGNKDQQAMPLMSHMADRGWVCVSINYRLSPRATWPDHIVDVKRAIAWVKANIAEHGGDPDFVCITGGSAGGHLSSLAALSANEPAFQPGFEDADTSVQAAVPIYGVYDFLNRDGTGLAEMEDMLARLVIKQERSAAPELWDQASSMSWVGPEAPPFFVIHGANDTLVPVEQARSFVAMLRAESKNPVAFAELPGAQHAFEVFDSPRTIFSASAVHRFLEAVRVRENQVADTPG